MNELDSLFEFWFDESVPEEIGLAVANLVVSIKAVLDAA